MNVLLLFFFYRSIKCMQCHKWPTRTRCSEAICNIYRMLFGFVLIYSYSSIVAEYPPQPDVLGVCRHRYIRIDRDQRLFGIYAKDSRNNLEHIANDRILSLMYFPVYSLHFIHSSIHFSSSDNRCCHRCDARRCPHTSTQSTSGRNA